MRALLLLRQVVDPNASAGSYITNAGIAWYARNDLGVQQDANVRFPNNVLGVQSLALFGVACESVYVGCWHGCGCRSCCSEVSREDLVESAVLQTDAIQHLDLPLYVVGIGTDLTVCFPSYRVMIPWQL
jgi:hypothetical protein